MTPPFITPWSTEHGFVVRPDPLVGDLAALFVASGARGEGTPLWRGVHVDRQRRCVAARCCQVCGETLAGDGFAVGNTWYDDRTDTVRSTDPLVCGACLPVALTSCPFLREQRHTQLDKAKAAMATTTAGVAGLGLELVRKSEYHYHVLRGRQVIAQWWPSSGKTMDGQRRGQMCRTGNALVAWLRDRFCKEVARAR